MTCEIKTLCMYILYTKTIVNLIFPDAFACKPRMNLAHDFDRTGADRADDHASGDAERGLSENRVKGKEILSRFDEGWQKISDGRRLRTDNKKMHNAELVGK